MKNVLDLIVLGVTFIAWLAYTCPALAEAKSTTARVVRRWLMFVVSMGVGWGFGDALAGVLL